MKLTYRGANYEYDIPTVDMIEGEVAGKYRGQNWNYRYPRHIPNPNKYGGTNYTKKRDAEAGDRDVAAARASERVESYPTVVEVAQVHRANICNILDRRQQAAKAKGDETLLRLLEIEWQQMAC
ncbi:DUF4278 domain-containing protein [Microcoleus vaginatus PCC 9802]|uniref:DUF4278 domain-containing protein n=1 Tax=Microcoleus vaginatus TaxID=119532 RepID=UPI00020D27AB|nr:hypothetical protein MicvaDRAFT_1541 [Microcoleus vaginatus FGP-2]UNU19276.1 DUF4278 domain-containing protein [Microcoleus vaginatus PCC 9802]